MELIVYDFTDIEKDSLEFSELSKIRGSGLLSQITLDELPLCIQVPLVKISHNLNENIELKFKLNNDELINFFKSLDQYFINIAHKNSMNWFNKDLPLDVITNFYKPIIEEESIDNDSAVVLNTLINLEDIDQIFNKNQENIDIDNLENNVHVIFQINGLRFLKQSFFCDLDIRQISEINNNILIDYDSDEDNNINSINEIDFNNIEDAENIEFEDLEISNNQLNEKTKIKLEIEKELSEMRKLMITKENELEEIDNEIKNLTI